VKSCPNWPQIWVHVTLPFPLEFSLCMQSSQNLIKKNKIPIFLIKYLVHVNAASTRSNLKQMPLAFTWGTGVYLRSSIYLNLNLMLLFSSKISCSNLKNVQEPLQYFSWFIALIPTKGSWHNVFYSLLITQFYHLVLNFIDYRKKMATFYSCCTYVVLYFAVILVNLRPKIKAVRNDEKIPHINKRQAPNKYQVQINPRSTRSSFK